MLSELGVAGVRERLASYTAETARLSFRKLLCPLPAFGVRPLFHGPLRILRGFHDRSLRGWDGMALAVMLRAQSKNESGEDKTERSLLLRRQDENLRPVLFRGCFHSGRRLT
jgi:hypothetical protein